MEQEMKYIYSVYKNKSFSKAASELFITQPALSIAVSRVESRIGMPLFDRSSKPLRLTAAGEYYIQKYKEISNLEHELDQQLNDLTSLQTGTLRIGGSHYFNSRILPPVLAEFASEYPGVRLELKEAGADKLLQMIYDQDIDITFNCIKKPKDSFVRIPCFSDTMILSVPESSTVNEKASDISLSPQDIAERKHLLEDWPVAPLSIFSNEPFVLLTPGNDLRARAEALFSLHGLEPFVRMEVNQLATSWRLSLAGIGAAFVTDFLVSGSEENVVFYKLDRSEASRVFDLTMSDRHYVSKAMTAFAEIMNTRYGPEFDRK